MSLPLIIDCDPGVDDAVMLMMALASDALDVRAITTVAGNVPLRLTSRNARMMCQLMGRREVPVYAGCRGRCCGRLSRQRTSTGQAALPGSIRSSRTRRWPQAMP